MKRQPQHPALEPVRRFNRYDPVKHAGQTPLRLDCCQFDLVEVYQWAQLEGRRYGESPGWASAEYEMCYLDIRRHKNRAATHVTTRPKHEPFRRW